MCKTLPTQLGSTSSWISRAGAVLAVLSMAAGCMHADANEASVDQGPAASATAVENTVAVSDKKEEGWREAETIASSDDAPAVVTKPLTAKVRSQTILKALGPVPVTADEAKPETPEPSVVDLLMGTSGATQNSGLDGLKFEVAQNKAVYGYQFQQDVGEDKAKGKGFTLRSGEEERIVGGKDGKKVTLGLLSEQDQRNADGDRWREGVGSTLAHIEPSREAPTSFIPDVCYVENTYLGGNAAYLARLQRLDQELERYGTPHRKARLQTPTLDAPLKSGLAVSATLSRRSFDGPQRVFLQVGLRGSDRFGWRRPPLEIMVVVDAAALEGTPQAAEVMVESLLSRLDTKDRLGLVVTDERGARVAVPLSSPKAWRQPGQGLAGANLTSMRGGSLAGAARLAVQHLGAAVDERTTLPGTQTVFVLTASPSEAQVPGLTSVAHSATVSGVVTSVVELGASQATWWSVAAAGHGNYHRALALRGPQSLEAAVSQELESLSRVVARLVRLNVRLRNGAKAVRVLGARVLDTQQVAAAKAREVATDKKLSRAMGIAADRGGDDDGIQTVIPYFYGGDSHVVVIALWVEQPGVVADVTVRYKDMVSLGNASAQTAASLLTVARADTMAQHAVAASVSSLELSQVLRAAARLARVDVDGAWRLLESHAQGDAARRDPNGARLVRSFYPLRGQVAAPLLADMLHLASERQRGAALPGS